MHAHNHGPSNPIQQLLKKAERLVDSHAEGRIGMVFQGITAVSLGAMTVMDVVDRIRRARQRDHERTDRHPASAALDGDRIRRAVVASTEPVTSMKRSARGREGGRD